jgi:hypothetical protein
MSNPFILNRDVIASGSFLQVTASLAPSHWGEDRKYPMRSALVEPNWESLDNWIYWVVGMCVHGQDRHISKIRWLFDINGESLVFTSHAGTEEEDYPGLPEAIAETKLIDHRNTGPLTPEDQLSCRAWTRYDDDDEPTLHHIFYLDWIKVVPTVYGDDGGFADLLTWSDAFGGDN